MTVTDRCLPPVRDRSRTDRARIAHAERVADGPRGAEARAAKATGAEARTLPSVSVRRRAVTPRHMLQNCLDLCRVAA